MEVPIVIAPNSEVIANSRICLIPEDAIFEFIGSRGVVYVQSGIVICDLIHNLTKERKVWDDTCIVLPKSASVPQVGLSKNKGSIYVCSDNWKNVHAVLKGEDKHHLPVTPVLKDTLKNWLL